MKRKTTAIVKKKKSNHSKASCATGSRKSPIKCLHALLSLATVCAAFTFYAFSYHEEALLAAISSTGTATSNRRVLHEIPPSMTTNLHHKHANAAQPQPNLMKIEEDTALIISTSWIPSLPSTDMMDQVLQSVDDYLVGLSPTAPIFVVVDHFPPPTPRALRARTQMKFRHFLKEQYEMDQMHATLDSYVTRLQSKYLIPNPRPIHIIPSVDHWHIGGNVYKAMTLIETHYPRVQYLYYLQHDFRFIRPIPHLDLVDIMRETSSQPPNVDNTQYRGQENNNKTKSQQQVVNYIRFRFRKFEPGPYTTCPMGPVTGDKVTILQKHNTTLFHSSQYSDNNHFVRFSWYKEIFEHLSGATSNRTSADSLKRAPEFPLQFKAMEDCHILGLYTYGKQFGEAPVLEHLDGRKTNENPYNPTQFLGEPVVIFLNVWIPKTEEFVPHELHSRNGMATRLLAEQLEQISKSLGVFGSLGTTVYVTTVENSGLNQTRLQAICDQATSNQIRCILQSHVDEVGMGEINALSNLYHYCHGRGRAAGIPGKESNNHNNKNARVVYLHNTHNNSDDSIYRWRRAITDAVTHQTCLNPPDKTCHVCGLQFVSPPNSPMPFFVDNSFTASCEYIQSLLPPKVFSNQMQQVATEGLRWRHRKRLLLLNKLGDGTLQSLGQGRGFATDHYIGSHPNLKPCDLSMEGSSSAASWQQRGPSSTTEDAFRWSMFPRSEQMEANLSSVPDHIRQDPDQRLRYYRFLPGLLFRYIQLYNSTPPESSWVYQHLPDGTFWREAVQEYGTNVVNVVTDPTFNRTQAVL